MKAKKLFTKNIKKNISEGLLIVFSVLFALFIDKLFNDYETEKQKALAIDSIYKELKQNISTLERWEKDHKQITDRITKMVSGKSDSLVKELSKYNFLNLSIITNNKSIIDATLYKTAWESAKATGIITEFDFKTTQKLTSVYAFQGYMALSISNITEYYYRKEAHDISQLNQTLRQLQIRFFNLNGQETIAKKLHNEAIFLLNDLYKIE
ncbi:hypothetical protein [Winogradskyella sp.]|uniref:hypothetical protein n=1 Tax=Winogradskyella sp. TaxID=1883156 RepID=UPI002639C413|nr:hypothetical protein [Winogradskyella sp.]